MGIVVPLGEVVEVVPLFWHEQEHPYRLADSINNTMDIISENCFVFNYLSLLEILFATLLLYMNLLSGVIM
jgi:hypothetical protein